MNNIELEIVECDGQESAAEAVSRGEADVVLGVDLSPIEGMHIVTTFKPKPFYFGIAKGNGDIAAQLNEAIASLENADPQLQSELYAKYIGGNENTSGLSADMVSYLEQKGTVRVGYVPGAAPIQDTDDATGEMRGASRGVLDYVSEYTGLCIETIEIPDDMAPGDAIAAYDLDMVAGVPHDFEYARNESFQLGTPYLKSLSWQIVNSSVDTIPARFARSLCTICHASIESRSVPSQSNTAPIAIENPFPSCCRNLGYQTDSTAPRLSARETKYVPQTACPARTAKLLTKV